MQETLDLVPVGSLILGDVNCSKPTQILKHIGHLFNNLPKNFNRTVNSFTPTTSNYRSFVALHDKLQPCAPGFLKVFFGIFPGRFKKNRASAPKWQEAFEQTAMPKCSSHDLRGPHHFKSGCGNGVRDFGCFCEWVEFVSFCVGPPSTVAA